MESTTPTDPRRLLGALGERLAREHLSRAGYELVESNFRSRRGELDIVAVDSRALVFCEVKTRVAGSRAGPANPLDAIGPAKQRRLRLLAREWLYARPDRPRAPALRFDAIGLVVTPKGELLSLEHVEDAF
ncbi:MAG: YraN family protein [Thermoleophilaceae bacterium]